MTDYEIDVEVFMHHRTDKALKVSLDGEAKNAVWVPAALCSFEEKSEGVGFLTLSERTAIEKGLI